MADKLQQHLHSRVSNIGAGPTGGAVSLKFTLPPGIYITANSLAGPGWTCTLATRTCTRARTDQLLPGFNYPPVTMTTQIILNTTAGAFDSTATISGGGDTTPANNSARDNATSFIGPVSTVDITITTVPAGLLVNIDGSTSRTPRYVTWQPGSPHTIKSVSPQPSPFQPNKQYSFTSWSDGGADEHNLLAPSTPTALVVTMTASWQRAARAFSEHFLKSRASA